MARKDDGPAVEKPDEQIPTPPEEVVDNAATDGPEVPEIDEVPEMNVDGPAPEKPAEPQPETASRNPLKRFWHWCATHKKLSIPLAIALVLGALAAIPASRYAIAGTFLKQDYSVSVVDSQTNKPITSASVMVDGKKAQTNNQGKVTVRVPVGNATVKVSKKYYKSAEKTALVPIFKAGSTSVKLTATGRQVPVTVINKISKTPLANAVIKAEGTETKTDKDGKAILVLPAGKQTVDAAITASGFNPLTTKVKVSTDVAPENTFSLVPAGKIYFLSNASGKIDVVKSNLDGTDRKVVLAGTGKEDENETVLLASRDWKYLALSSKRDGGDYAKLFLIETATDTTSTIDEGDATFELVGWGNHHFVYKVERAKLDYYANKKSGLKTFNAETKKLTIIDETVAEESDSYSRRREYFGSVYITQRDNRVIYTKGWSASNGSILEQTQKKAALIAVNPDGSNRKEVKTFAAPPGGVWNISIYLYAYSPNEIYVVYSADDQKVYEYENNSLKAADVAIDVVRKGYPTYLQSPSGDHTFWTKVRDGKNVLFVGGTDGENEKQLGNPAAEQHPFGWFTDNYVVLSKKGSELLIMSSDPSVKAEPIKITDYYKPVYSYPGYGGGYGGF